MDSYGKVSMNYQEFLKTLRQDLQQEAGAKVEVNLHRALKNNDVIKEGILFCQKGNPISPVLYMEEYFEAYQNGTSYEKIILELLETYEEVKEHNPLPQGNLNRYEDICRQVVYRLVNKSKNRLGCCEVPFVPYLDLVITFHVLIRADESGMVSMPIKTEHLARWGVTREELFQRAKENTKRLLPGEMVPMTNVLRECGLHKDSQEEELLYVLTNGIRSYGAAAVLEEGMMEKAAIFFGENYYVIPSSIHEVLLLPESKCPGKAALEEMVKTINLTEVCEEEILSDQVYYYDSRQKVLL